MAVTTKVTKVVVAMKLDNGTTASGTVKTVSVPFGSLNKAEFDAEKVMNIVGLLAQMFSKSLYTVQRTETSELEEA